MNKKLSRKLFYTLMAFACLNVFMLTSCGENEAEAPAETTAPAEAPAVQEAPAAETPVATDATAPATTDSMDSAETRPTEPSIKK